MTDRDVHSKQVLSAAVANAVGETVLVTDQRNVVLTFSTSGSAVGTLKVAGASAGKEPNFGATAAVGNEWTYIQSINLEDGSVVDGTAGIAYTGTDGVYTLEVNTNGLDYITVILSGRSAGSFNVRARVYNNQ